MPRQRSAIYLEHLFSLDSKQQESIEFGVSINIFVQMNKLNVDPTIVYEGFAVLRGKSISP